MQRAPTKSGCFDSVDDNIWPPLVLKMSGNLSLRCKKRTASGMARVAAAAEAAKATMEADEMVDGSSLLRRNRLFSGEAQVRVSSVKKDINNKLEALSDNDLKIQCLEELLVKLKPRKKATVGEGIRMPSAGVTPSPPARNPNAFATTAAGVPRKNDLAAFSAKSKAIRKMSEAMKGIGDTEKQICALRSHLCETQNRAVAFQVKDLFATAPDEMTKQQSFAQLVELLDLVRKGRRTNDAETFMRTPCVAVAPTMDGNDKVLTASALNKMAKTFEAPPASFKRRIGKACIACKDLISRLKGEVIKLAGIVQAHARKGNSRFTKNFIEDMHHWTLQVSNNVVCSPSVKDVVMVCNPDTKKKEARQKCHCRFGPKDLHMEMTKPKTDGGFDGATDKKGNITISETVLRVLMPKEVVSITAKSQTATLNAWRTKHKNLLVDRARRVPAGPVKVTLQAKANKHRQEAFLEGGNARSWNHPRDAVASMTCATVGDNWCGAHKLACALQRCEDCKDKLPPVPALESVQT